LLETRFVPCNLIMNDGSLDKLLRKCNIFVIVIYFCERRKI